jgi:hypothetical protein
MVKNFLLMFFKDIRERGAHQVPKEGPVFFVCAPHANQFVDPSLIMAFAPRNVGYIAAKISLDNVKAVGFLGRAMEAIPVMRPQDYAITGKGIIYTDPNDAKIIRGVGTSFKSEVKPRCLLSVPNKDSVEVAGAFCTKSTNFEKKLSVTLKSESRHHFLKKAPNLLSWMQTMQHWLPRANCLVFLFQLLLLPNQSGESATC